MIAQPKPYPVMKDSGFEWIGEVPEHWDVRRNGRLFAQRNETGFAELPVLEVSLRTGVRIRDFKNSDRKQVMSDRDKYKRALAGDIAYNMMRMWQGAVGVAPVDGLISPAYVVARPLSGTETRYFEKLFRTPIYMQQVDNYSRGIVKDRNRLYWEYFKAMPTCYPPSEEQIAIVRYLDYVDQRVRRLVGAKQKLIALLNEYKRAIIHRAVTRGFNPGVPLKDSGVEWLGEVPEQWEVTKLRYISRKIIDGTHFTPSYVNNGVPFVRVTDISKYPLDPSTMRKITEEEHLEINKRCNPEFGDLLISKNGSIGITRVVDWKFPSSIFVSLCLIKLLKSKADPWFISFAFEGGLLEHQLSEVTKRTSVTNLHLDKIRGLVIPLPPVSEQVAILNRTKIEVEPIEFAITRAFREIELLTEYRTRLFSDVVTGKLDVREAAAELPEEDPLAANGEPEDTIDRDTEGNLDEIDAIPK